MHWFAASSCTQRTPAGFPFGMPGIADEIDGAVQQAPHPERQESLSSLLLFKTAVTSMLHIPSLNSKSQLRAALHRLSRKDRNSIGNPGQIRGVFDDSALSGQQFLTL
jgi:hypothetical protein